MTWIKNFPLLNRLMHRMVILSMAILLLFTHGARNNMAEVARAAPQMGIGLTALLTPAGNIIYVNKTAIGYNNGSSWENAFSNLQSALNVAASSDEIWVAAGVYTPTLPILITDACSATFSLKSGVGLYGGFLGNESSRQQRDWRAYPTLLSGDLLGDDIGFTNNGENSYHVVLAQNLNPGTRLDGFIIQGGNSNSLNAPNDSGGGLYNSNGSPTLSNLVFFQNYSTQGGGLYNINGSNLMVNCAWIGNRAEFGGGLRNNTSNPTLINALFHANFAGSRGGGIYNTNSNPQFINATIVNNQDFYEHDGVFNDNLARPVFKNSILYGNYGHQIANESGGDAELRYSLLEGGCSDMSCYGTIVTDDPGFEDPDGLDDIFGNLDDNFHMTARTQALDGGSNSAVPTDILDLDSDGNTAEAIPYDLDDQARFQDHLMIDSGEGIPPIVDMGAYETQTTIFLPLIMRL